MKTIRPTILLAALLAPVTALLAAPKAFEGRVRFLMKEGKNAINLDQTIKRSMVRNDMQTDGHNTSMILDMEKREMIILMPEQQMYMTMPMREAAKAAQDAAQKADTKVELTNETETILGYKCKKLLVHSKEGITEIWGAEGIGMFMMGGGGGPMGRGQAPKHAWENVLAENGFFPLRLVTRSPAGKETLRMEAQEIDTATPSDSAFLPPPDYQKFEMPVMPGMGGGAEQTDKPASDAGKSRVPLLPNLNPFKKKSN